MDTLWKNKIAESYSGGDVIERKTAKYLNMARPLLKWAGGKTQLLGEILPKIPKKYGRFIEPFFGGGAVFFAVRPTD